MMYLMIEKYLKNLYDFFQKNQFELTVNNFIHKWFISLFTQNFNHDLSDIILDFFFLEGYIILTKTCLGVFAVLRKQLMKGEDFEEIYTILSEKTNDIKNPQLILYFLARRKFEFKLETLDHFREILQLPIIENLRKGKQKRKNSKSTVDIRSMKNLNVNKIKKKVYCDPKWPFCINDNNPHDILQVLVLNSQKRPYIIDDYYYTKTFSYPNEKEGKIDEYFISGDKDVVLERQKHHCDDRKLVESSIIMLDNNKTRSSSSDFNKNGGNNEKVSLYEMAKKGTGFEKAKTIILGQFQPTQIQEQEILEYI